MKMHEHHLREAVTLARRNVEDGGSAYGAVIVRDGEVIARAANEVHATNDPTAHAEAVALRLAGKSLGRPKLEDCVVYASGRPCPMCHAAMRLAGIREAYFAFTAEEAEVHGAGSASLYGELCLPLDEQPMRVRHMPLTDEPAPYSEWAARRR